MSSQTQSKVIKGALSIAAARPIIIIAGLVSTVVLARLLSPEDFGLVAIASSVMVLIAAMSELSLSQALIQHKDPGLRHYHTAFTLNLIRALILAGILAAAAFPVADFYDDQRLADILLLLAASSALTGLNNPKLAAMERDLVFWQEFLIPVVERVATLVVSVAIAIIFRSYWALVLGTVAGQLARTIVSYMVIHYRPALTLVHWRELLSFSIWVSLAKLVQMANWRIDPMILAVFVSPARVGYYTMADNLAGLPHREGLGPIKRTLFPAFSTFRDNLEQMGRAYIKAQSVMVLIAFPICFGLAVVSELAVELVIGPKWMPAVPLMQVLALAIGLQTAAGFDSIAMAVGKTQLLFRRQVSILVIRLGFVFAGIYLGLQYGWGVLLGAVLGRLVAAIINTMINFSLLSTMIPVTWAQQAGLTLRPLLASMAMAAAVWGAQQFWAREYELVIAIVQLLALVALGVLVYIAVLAILWLMFGRNGGAEAEAVRLIKSFAGKATARFSPSKGHEDAA